MKEKFTYCLFMLFCLFATSTLAQRINKSFRNVSMSDALVAIDKASQEWEVNFIYDELEDFRVTCDISNKSVPDAVRAVAGFYPISISIEDNTIYVECTQKEPYKLIGRLVDTRNKPISYANITLFSLNDTTKINTGVSNESGWFTIPCPVNRAQVRISHVGFITIHRKMDIKDVGIIHMEEETKQIDTIQVNESIIERNMSLTEDYIQYANQVRQKVWEMDMSHFLDTICPKELKDSSFVILAKYDETNILLKKDKINSVWPFFIIGAAGYFFWKQLGFHSSHLYRIRIKLNDEKAVSEWSSIKDYQKKIHLKTSKFTFVGIKIKKPNGSIIYPNVDKYVCPNTGKNRIKNRPKDLPIKDINKGDILDIFWYNESINLPYTEGEKTMNFADSHPTLHKQYKFTLPPNYYVNINCNNRDITVMKSFDMYGNLLYSIEGSPNSIRHLTDGKQILFRYWNYYKKAKRYLKKENLSYDNNQ